MVDAGWREAEAYGEGVIEWVTTCAVCKQQDRCQVPNGSRLEWVVESYDWVVVSGKFYCPCCRPPETRW